MNTINGLRLHIGFFGKRNAGKSIIVNKISGQELSIVSDIKGTTTDVNQKAMELLPIGPVVLIDTAGIDDTGNLGIMRIEKAIKAYQRCDVIVFVADYEPLSQIEKEFIKKAKEDKLPVLAVINKTDIKEIDNADYEFLAENSNIVLKTGENEDRNVFVSNLKDALIKILPDDYINTVKIMPENITENDTVILVIPIDKEAPKGRIILPQVSTIREALDNDITTVVVTVEKLKSAIENLKIKPKLVITDSQAFKKVDKITPNDIGLTSFSILFAKMKGDLKSFIKGSEKLDNIKDDDKILILESCTHHPVEDDIGRVKIPDLIRKYTNKTPVFEHFSGHDMPNNIDKYSLIIHCGGCMTNRREILRRIKLAEEKNIPITNYGITIAKCLGILDRAVKPLLN